MCPREVIVPKQSPPEGLLAIMVLATEIVPSLLRMPPPLELEAFAGKELIAGQWLDG